MTAEASETTGVEGDDGVRKGSKMVGFRFPTELLDGLRLLARKNDRTVTAELMRAIRRHLADPAD